MKNREMTLEQFIVSLEKYDFWCEGNEPRFYTREKTRWSEIFSASIDQFSIMELCEKCEKLDFGLIIAPKIHNSQPMISLIIFDLVL